MTQPSSPIDHSWTFALLPRGSDSPLELCATSTGDGMDLNQSELFNGVITRVGDSSSFKYTEEGKKDIDGTVLLVERFEPSSSKFEIGDNEVEVAMRPHPFDVWAQMSDIILGGRRRPFNLGEAVSGLDRNVKTVSLLGETGNQDQWKEEDQGSERKDESKRTGIGSIYRGFQSFFTTDK
ncbi:hypothetical protein I302_101094 [Kwoniella bestiolae CBS 10118]|uniref:Uncharacterized protein n=1 Tax=Kwoniella bestiolae CBS 10118 TaxID=1296100 RepID=A0A1B9G719_9TREE|nr:hypothetical protein I302_04469 [Kwoniella bestiolae CBS 10118]OCF26780.1 hypothetical protein I302_04469 [Kwoniella bestiolae CBS 10118]